jgi:hypothetical protein
VLVTPPKAAKTAMISKSRVEKWGNLEVLVSSDKKKLLFIGTERSVQRTFDNFRKTECNSSPFQMREARKFPLLPYRSDNHSIALGKKDSKMINFSIINILT